MNGAGWTEIALTLALTVALAWPLGIYLARIWQREKTWLDPVLRPVERLLYAGAGVQHDKSQSWLAYALSFLAFSSATLALKSAKYRFRFPVITSVLQGGRTYLSHLSEFPAPPQPRNI